MNPNNLIKNLPSSTFAAIACAAVLAAGLFIGILGVSFAQAQNALNTACSLSVEPATAAPGDSVALFWTTENADTLTVDQDIGTLDPVSGGSMTVTPSASITYTGEANGPYGTSTCTATLSVVESAAAQEPITVAAPAIPIPAPIQPTLTYPAPGTTPAPMIADISSDGSATMRGTVESVGANTMTIGTWGGTWTVRTSGLSNIIPAGAVAGDVSGIAVGDFVGIEGTVAFDQAHTVDADFVRNWTTDPYVAPTLDAADGAGAIETEEEDSTADDTTNVEFIDTSDENPTTTEEMEEAEAGEGSENVFDSFF